MKYHTYVTARRYSLRCLLVLFSFCFLSLNSREGYSQGLVASPKNSNLCAGVWHCCQQLKYTAPAGGGGVDQLIITCGNTNTAPPPSCNCWDWACNGNWSTSQNPAPAIVVVNNNPGWTITFTPALAPGQTFTIMLCPVLNMDGCAYQWTTFAWQASLNGVIVDPVNPPGQTPIYQCDANDGFHKNSTCPGCDRVDLYNNLPCDERVCITRHWPAKLGKGKSFNITISPPLQGCNRNSITGCLEEYTLNGPTLDPDEVADGWVLTDVGNPPGQNYTLSNANVSLEGCFSVCFDIPACDPPVNHTVSVDNPNDHADCDESSASASFKKASGPGLTSLGGNQNFPNPVTSATEFKTTIPFEISGGGTAKITIMDASGKTVFTYSQDFDGAGKHFFYFTGKQLPAGKYFYTIESPLGVAIVKQSLLIVK